ncbi:MAG: NAD synthetase / Glutamine amidotransferase chain of NAD synthetase [uncultured Ramlibacter sp.]|uniref:Glutamine-dependent NAD(+) synthetase n=1 Tax=uncultured Ramlibacter sp. TaxID=260755 RepID=A0A6J4P076_9BURK|nr:MAG: NAD synthetase / Glutamine amidotransferase chain of NAD synthetase [uncultured Ramlibacter sp.]
MALHICIAQLNYMVGDMAGNARKIVEAARAAYAAGARLILTPELSICGYAAEDLFLRPAFIAECDDAVKTVARELAGLKGLHVVVGHPVGGDVRSKSVQVQRRLNAASVLNEGRVLETYAKRELPNYQVFDERRYFTPGKGTCVFPVEGINIGLLICEDAWFEEPALLAQESGAELLAVINASPFHVGKGGERISRMADRAKAVGLPIVYAHLVGGQDEVVFDGASFAVSADGELVGRAPAFREDVFTVQADRAVPGVMLKAAMAEPRELEADLWDALVLGVRDYIGKNGFPGVLLGLSGGIDSALVLAIAVDALGKDKVRAVMMPSPYTADISWIDARDMAARLGVRYDEISIAPQFEAFKASLAGEFKGLPEDTTEENIQARIRGVLLMALSNKFGSIVLTTGNKSEMATGYCTLYGDMAGGFAVIKDVLKTAVFRLARWRNAHDPYGTGANPIPERIITRPPSAELRPDQVDQDSLPPYEVLDAILSRYMENDEGVEQIVAAGFDRAVVERVARLVRINEYKRRQAPVGIRVTHRGFGKDWRYPITGKFRA